MLIAKNPCVLGITASLTDPRQKMRHEYHSASYGFYGTSVRQVIGLCLGRLRESDAVVPGLGSSPVDAPRRT